VCYQPRVTSSHTYDMLSSHDLNALQCSHDVRSNSQQSQVEWRTKLRRTVKCSARDVTNTVNDLGSNMLPSSVVLITNGEMESASSQRSTGCLPCQEERQADNRHQSKHSVAMVPAAQQRPPQIATSGDLLTKVMQQNARLKRALRDVIAERSQTVSQYLVSQYYYLCLCINSSRRIEECTPNTSLLAVSCQVSNRRQSPDLRRTFDV